MLITKLNFSKYFLLIAIGLFFSNCEEKKTEKSKLIGLWTLESMKVKDSANNWNAYRGGMKGYLMYDVEGNVALHLYDNDYEDYKPSFPNFTDTISSEALKHVTKSYYYMGNYQVSEKDSIVTHTKLSHSNPSEFRGIAERRFYFSGDTLIMVPVEQKNARLKLKWLKSN